jgi:hypothetical protein
MTMKEKETILKKFKKGRYTDINLELKVLSKYRQDFFDYSKRPTIKYVIIIFLFTIFFNFKKTLFTLYGILRFILTRILLKSKKIKN